MIRIALKSQLEAATLSDEVELADRGDIFMPVRKSAAFFNRRSNWRRTTGCCTQTDSGSVQFLTQKHDVMGLVFSADTGGLHSVIPAARV